MPTITATTAAERKADRRAEALAKLNPATIPAVQTGDRVLIAPGYGHSAVGATVVEGPDAEGYVVARFAGPEPLCLDIGQDAWLQPGTDRRVAWGDGLVALVIGELAGAHGNAIPEGRAIRPAPQVVTQVVERVVEIKPSQPVPRSEDAERRRNRAGNTVRKQTAAGTWAPINMGADGERFQRQQLTTKLHPQARQRLDQLAADAGLRACEVLEALLLDRGAAAAVSKARPMGVGPAREPQAKPGADRTGERRTRLTKAQGERLDQLLLAMLQSGRTSKAELERVSAAAATDGLPAQGLSTLRTRLRRLQQQQEAG
jgi:hypothetical protein